MSPIRTDCPRTDQANGTLVPLRIIPPTQVFTINSNSLDSLLLRITPFYPIEETARETDLLSTKPNTQYETVSCDGIALGTDS